MKRTITVLISMTLGMMVASAQGPNNPCIGASTNTICLTYPSVLLSAVAMSNSTVCLGNPVSATTTPTVFNGSARTDTTYSNCPSQTGTPFPIVPTVTNWWVASGPDGFSATDSGLSATFTPTSTGGGTLTFYSHWSSPAPCATSATASSSAPYLVGSNLPPAWQTNCLKDGSVSLDGVAFNPTNSVCLGASITASTATILSNALLRVVDTNNCAPSHTNQAPPVVLTNWWEVTGLTVTPPSGSGLSATFSSTNKGNGTITFYARWTNLPPCNGSGTASTNAAFTNRCPIQTAAAGTTQCGPARYGARISYTYDCAFNWWILENVNWGATTTCSPGAPPITQTTNAFQMGVGVNSVSDDISNPGNPATVADCTDITDQTISLGPTQATVGICTFMNTQTITVTRTNAPATPPHGTVVTSSAGATASCNW